MDADLLNVKSPRWVILLLKPLSHPLPGKGTGDCDVTAQLSQESQSFSKKDELVP